MKATWLVVCALLALGCGDSGGDAGGGNAATGGSGVAGNGGTGTGGAGIAGSGGAGTGIAGSGGAGTGGTGIAGSGGTGTAGSGGAGAPTAVRFVNLRTGGAAINVCIGSLDSGDDGFNGPLLDSVLPPGHVEQHLDVATSASPVLRWIEGDDCTASGITDDVPFTVAADERYTAVLFGGDTLQTSIYETDVVGEILPRRFYTRFFNGALNTGALDTKQIACNTPIAAFENTEFGTLGFSPNNGTTFFSASVSIGLDSFTTDIVLCDDDEEIYRRMYAFLGGQVVTFFLLGDGGTTPYTVTICDDNESSAERCVPVGTP